MKTIEVLIDNLPRALREAHEKGHELWAASRPLLGSYVPDTGSTYVGYASADVIGAPRLWAVIDPNDSLAEKFRERNLSLDGARIVPQTLATFQARFEAEVAKRGLDLQELIDIYGSWERAARTCNYPI